FDPPARAPGPDSGAPPRTTWRADAAGGRAPGAAACTGEGGRRRGAAGAPRARRDSRGACAEPSTARGRAVPEEDRARTGELPASRAPPSALGWAHDEPNPDRAPPRAFPVGAHRLAM